MIWGLLGLVAAGAGLAYVASRSVPQGALDGCVFNEQDLDLWGRANNIHIIIDGTHAVGSPNETNILHWQTGSRVLMIVTTDGDFVPDWHAVNSYCRYNLAQGSIGSNLRNAVGTVRNAQSAEVPNWMPPGGWKVG